MKIIIDRFEGSVAVCEYEGGRFTLPRSLLPKDAAEGDFLKLTLDKSSQEIQQKEIEALENKLFR